MHRKQPNKLVILATSPAGLGHIRVMEALRQGLTTDVILEEMGISDPSMQWIHRISSRNVFFRTLMETVQSTPYIEDQFTRFYGGYLRGHTEVFAHQLTDAIKRPEPQPKEVVLVCTHFGLAHQAASIKRQIEWDLGVFLTVAVIVTDDSPQKMWAVYGADIIFVPSRETKRQLTTFLHEAGDYQAKIAVVSYPISLALGKLIPDTKLTARRQQVQVKNREALAAMIPISGAAVQLSYVEDLLMTLWDSVRVRVTVVSRDSQHTHEFLDWCQEQPDLNVLADEVDTKVVALYEKAMLEELPAIEITKPSEQAFKCLYTPKQYGGVILLFSPPVGRQEYDNINFMMRFGLLPSFEAQSELEDLFLKHKYLPFQLIKAARGWRGLLLPGRGDRAGEYISWLKRVGVLEAMGNFKGFSEGIPELSDSGVEKVWHRVLG